MKVKRERERELSAARGAKMLAEHNLSKSVEILKAATSTHLDALTHFKTACENVLKLENSVPYRPKRRKK